MKFILKKDKDTGCIMWMPEELISASEEEISKAVGKGGCGPGKYGDKLVPDKIYGLNIKPACKVHDFSWFLLKTYHDRVLSDCMFLCNMLLLNDNDKSSKFIKWLRLHAPGGIYHYYEAVAYLA